MTSTNASKALEAIRELNADEECPPQEGWSRMLWRVQRGDGSVSEFFRRTPETVDGIDCAIRAFEVREGATVLSVAWQWGNPR